MIADRALDGLRSIKSYPARSSGVSFMSVDDRPTLSAPDDDPWLWLEDIEGKQALDFVERQNQLTLAAFGGTAYEHDRDILAAIYDRPDNIPYVSRRGAHLHNLWKDAINPRGLWRRTTLAEFREARPAWEIVLDIDQLQRAKAKTGC
jgi:prolyl oligopeptidase